VRAGPAPSLALALPRGALVLPAVIVVSSLYALSVASWTVIARDQWRIYDHYLSNSFPGNVLAVQNGHRPVVPGLFFLADLHLLGASNYFLGVAGMSLAALVAGLWSRLAWRETAFDATTRALAAGIPWIAVFWLASERTLGHGSEAVQNFCTLSGLLLGVRAIARARDSPHRLAMAPLAAAGCLVATFSFGSGIVSWVVVVGVALGAGAPAGSLALLAGGFLVTTAIYVSAVWRPALRSYSGLGATLQDAAVWLGAPLYYALRPFRPRGIDPDTGFGLSCGLLGGLGLALAGGLVARRLLRRQAGSELEVWSTALVAFVAGTAFSVAVGRAGLFKVLPAERLAPRYVIWTCVFWAGLLVLLGLEAARSRRRGLARAWRVAVVLLTLGILPAHSARNLEYAKYRLEDAAIAVALGVQDAGLTERLAPPRNAPAVYSVAEWLRRRATGIAAWPLLKRMGQPFEGSPRPARGDRAGPREPALSIVGAPEAPALHFSGTLADAGGLSADLVVVDEENVVRGLGRIAGGGHRLARRIGLLAPMPPLYHGTIPAPAETARYTIFALTADRRSAVRLAVVPGRGMRQPAPPSGPPGQPRSSIPGKK